MSGSGEAIAGLVAMALTAVTIYWLPSSTATPSST